MLLVEVSRRRRVHLLHGSVAPEEPVQLTFLIADMAGSFFLPMAQDTKTLAVRGA
jgi:hypothetical protein